ncbi:HD family hydrolase, partial [Martelella alba]
MTWITTFSGRHFDYADPDINSICITDIIHALSNECRYAGHCSQFYSVAQHSVLTSMIVPPAFALEALLHDAAEAYCKDIPAPLKRLLPDYHAVENRVDAVIRRRFGLPEAMSPEVKRADLIMLATERRDLD